MNYNMHKINIHQTHVLVKGVPKSAPVIKKDKVVHCTLNKLKLTFATCATLSHFTCMHGGNWKGFVF